MKTYRIADYIPRDIREKFGMKDKSTIPYWSGHGRSNEPYLVAVFSGEIRPPKKGEFYLSGSIAEAYRAPNDLTTPFHIARIVKVRQTTTTKIIQE